MNETQTESIIEDLQSQIDIAEKRAQNAEKVLAKAKEELLALSIDDTKGRYSELEKQFDELQQENHQLTLALHRLQRQLTDHQRDANHWRGRFLLSEIDVVTASCRAEEAESKLTEAIKPVPFDQERLIKERELSWMAFLDPLTNLGNSNKLDLQLVEDLNSAMVNGQLLALLLIDIDKFCLVNDYAGWEEGNELLKSLGERLAKNTPESTFLARRGEDKFALVISMDVQGEMNESGLVRVRQIADFLLNLIKKPFTLNYQPYSIKGSMGISIFPDDADNPQELMENAHSAVRTAKQQGGDRYVIFNERVFKEKEERATLAADLKAAIEQNRIEFHYRPVADLNKGNLAAALVEPSWEHQAHGRVAQEHFIPLAEDYGLMPDLVGQILAAACEMSRKMKGTISTILRCPTSVLHIPEFERKFMDGINASRIKPQSLTLELPAEALREHPVRLGKLFSELKRWGVGCAIRVLESSSLGLSGLHEVGLSMIILDGQLLKNVPSQENRRSVVQSYLDLSQRMAIPILALGLSENTQAHFLAIHKCRWASGDFISPALSLSEFLKRRRTTWQFT